MESENIYYLIQFTLTSGAVRWAWKNDFISEVKLLPEEEKEKASRFTDREVLTINLDKYKRAAEYQFLLPIKKVTVIQVTETVKEKEMLLSIGECV